MVKNRVRAAGNLDVLMSLGSRPALVYFGRFIFLAALPKVESILNNNWQFNHYTAAVRERRSTSWKTGSLFRHGPTAGSVSRWGGEKVLGEAGRSSETLLVQESAGSRDEVVEPQIQAKRQHQSRRSVENQVSRWCAWREFLLLGGVVLEKPLNL